MFCMCQYSYKLSSRNQLLKQGTAVRISHTLGLSGKKKDRIGYHLVCMCLCAYLRVRVSTI